METAFDEIMTENFPKIPKTTDIQVEKAQRVPKKMNLNKFKPRNRVEMANVKDKEITLKTARENRVV